MKEKKKSAVSWILEWAGQKRSAYVWSVVLAVGNVIFKIIPYFIIANVVTMFLDGSKEFKEYLIMAIWIALSFIIAELFIHFLHRSLIKQRLLYLQIYENLAVKSWRGCRLDM